MPLIPSHKRGLGAILEGSKSFATPDIGSLKFAVRRERPNYHTLEEFIPVDRGQAIILNQGSTNSCVAHAFAHAIAIVECRAGLPYLPVSRLFAYYHARREMNPRIPFVFDTGTYLRTCAKALMHFGVPDETHWPFSENTLKVNLRPSFNALRWAHPRSGGKYAKIYQWGEARSDVIKDSLMAGYPVAFGMEVTKDFLKNDGEPYIVPKAGGEIAGGHAMLIIGWAERDGVCWFRVLNSWGRKWRDNGLCWIHQDVIESPSADDFHVITGWNRVREAPVTSL